MKASKYSQAVSTCDLSEHVQRVGCHFLLLFLQLFGYSPCRGGILFLLSLATAHAVAAVSAACCLTQHSRPRQVAVWTGSAVTAKALHSSCWRGALGADDVTCEGLHQTPITVWLDLRQNPRPCTGHPDIVDRSTMNPLVPPLS